MSRRVLPRRMRSRRAFAAAVPGPLHLRATDITRSYDASATLVGRARHDPPQPPRSICGKLLVLEGRANVTPNATSYDTLLRFQADLSFDLEQMFFRSASAWKNARRVLDFGAGNGYYTRLLAERNPDKTFTCVDRDASLAEVAREWTRRLNVTVVHGTHVNIAPEIPFDFVFARHVMSYLPQRHEFMAWVREHTSDAAAVLTIDADDTALLALPRLPFLESGNDKFKDDVHAQGGDRSLIDKLPGEWQEHAFKHVSTRGLVVHSEIDGRKPLLYLFMKQVAAMDHGYPLPAAVSEEIDTWVANPSSYLQYGLFGSLFEKVNSAV